MRSFDLHVYEGRHGSVCIAATTPDGRRAYFDEIDPVVAEMPLRTERMLVLVDMTEDALGVQGITP